jgi:hypothetical protein
VKQAATALFIICACGPQPSPPNCIPQGQGGFGGEGGFIFDAGFAGGAGGSGAPETILDTGHVAMIALTLNPTLCGDQKANATAVNTSVRGPDNLPFAHTNSGPDNGSLSSDPYTTVITFTPDKPGDYHLVADFEPNLGQVQLDLRVARDLSQVKAQATYGASLVQGCASFAVTDLGTLICGDSMGVHLIRAAARSDVATGEQFAVLGNTVWVADSSSMNVSSFTDTGSGALMPAVSFSTPENAQLLLPFEGGVLVIMNTQISRYVASGTSATSDRTWMPPTASFNLAALLGDDLLIAGNAGFYASFGTTELKALPWNFQPLGFGPEGIWAADLSTAFEPLVLLQAGQHAPVATAFGPSAQGWQQTSAAVLYGPLPSSSGDPTYFAHFDPNAGITLDDWGPPPANRYFVTGSWAVFPQPNGDVVVKKAPAL